MTIPLRLIRQVFLTIFPLALLTTAARAADAAKSPPVEPGLKADPDGFEKIARPFLEAHCAKCHSGEKVKGHYDLAKQALNDFADNTSAEHWKKALELVRNNEMPPSKEPRPDAAQAGDFMEWVDRELHRGERARKPAAVTIRRLNRAMYNNTIRDLLGIPLRPADEFPADAQAAGFDNISAALTLSPLQLDLFTQAAAAAVDHTIFPGPRPDSIRWHLEVEDDREGSDRTRIKTDGQNILLNSGENVKKDGMVRVHHGAWNTGVSFRDFKVPAPGRYLLRLRAAGLVPDREAVVASAEKFLAARRDEELAKNPRGAKYIRQQYEDDLAHFRNDRNYTYGPPRITVTLTLGGQPKPVAELDIPAPPGKPDIYGIPLEMDTQSAGISVDYSYKVPQMGENFWMQEKPGFARPELLLDWMELEGPVHPVWPPECHTRLLPPSPLRESDPRAYARLVLERFMPLAWRRPVTAAEVDRKLTLFDRAWAESPVIEEAIRLPLTAVLASPSFLFLVEDTAPGAPLSAWQAAARLSYFLWSAPPDERLRTLAASGEILKTDTLLSEVARLLADPRAAAFTEGFADQWLDLRKVGANPPAMNLYPQYDRHLETSLTGETRAFFNEILHQDLPVATFLKSDFVTINERLARFYGISGVRGDEFRKVILTDKSGAGSGSGVATSTGNGPSVQRGGLVTQAAMLTTTSNGTRTSPVMRGVWVLKTLLNQDPGIPPANVGEVPPKVPGIDKATVRQRLEIHRQLPQCARCHQKIDPLGLALENFNAAGEWRDREGFGYNGRIEKEDPLINAASTLADGSSINGVDGLRGWLLTRQEDFQKCLLEKMATYALGREMTLADEPALREIHAAWQKNGLTLKNLIGGIVSSPMFLRK